MKRALFKIILSLFCFGKKVFLLNGSDERIKHVCVHDTRFKNLKPTVLNFTEIPSKKDNRRFLSTSPSFHKMRISIDYGSNSFFMLKN